jgi:hypothetical protein
MILLHKLLLGRLPAAWLALALGTLTSATTFGAQVPFKGTFDTVAESTVNVPFANVHVVGEGQASYLGQSATETTDQLVNLITGAGTATYKFTGADGAELHIAFVFQTVPLPSQPGVSLPGTWTVVGGTGRFAGVTGSGIVDGTVIFISQTTGLGHFTMNGTLSIPGQP